MAGARIAQHFGRPGTPNDQAWVKSFSGHLKGEFPHLDKITDPGDLEAELDRLRAFWNGTRLHEGIGYVTPTTNTKDEVRPSEPHDEQGCKQPAKHGLPPDDSYDKITNDRPHQWMGIQNPNWFLCSDAPRVARPDRVTLRLNTMIRPWPFNVCSCAAVWVRFHAAALGSVPSGRSVRVDLVTMVAAAFATGAAAGATDTAKQAVLDAYAALKGLITRRYGVIEADLTAVENDPEEPLRRQLLAKQLGKVGASDDLEVQAAAEELLRAVAEQAPAAAEAVGVKLTRVEAGGDIEVSDFVGSAQRVLEAADVKVGGSFRIKGVRAGRTSEDPTAAHG